MSTPETIMPQSIGEARWDILADGTRDLPSGKATAVFGFRETGHAVVQVLYVKVPSRGKSVKTREFDDGNVVVDYNDAGQFVAIEMLGETSEQRGSDFLREADASPDHVLRVAAQTCHFWWHVFTEAARMVREPFTIEQEDPKPWERSASSNGNRELQRV